MSPSPFYNLQVQQGFHQGHVIAWTLDPAFHDTLPYTFTLEASETPDFSELVYSKESGDTFYATDDTKLVQNLSASLLYRVRLTTGSGKTYYSRSINYDYHNCTRSAYLHARETTRLEMTRIRMIGKDGWVLKQKNYTAVDPKDIDPVSGVPINDQSGSFGTGLAGGYYSPLKVRFSRENQMHMVELNPDGSGVSQKLLAKLRFVGFPLLGTRDVVVFENDERYHITMVQPRYYPGTEIVIVQNVDVRLIPPSDPVYQITTSKN